MVRLGAARCARLAAALLLTAGCASPPEATPERRSGAGTSHVLRPGENLYRLSRFYGVSVEDITRANQIGDVTNLQVGQRLWIPGAPRPAPAKSLARASVVPLPGGRSGREAELRFGWPVRGRTSSKYGWRAGGRHQGIDIRAPRGTLIRAAAAGRVIHSGGGLGAYGQVVIVKHVGRFSTVYAHNRRNRVAKGAFVEKGDVIGEVGSTGNASGPHVHFEVRRDRIPLDPLLYLP